MDDKGKIQKRAESIISAVAPTIRTAVEAMAPVMAALASEGEKARRALGAFAAVWSPRRPAVSKPCAWCVDSHRRPATHLVKWTRGFTWELSPEEGGGVWRVLEGHRTIMCEFHACIAERYDGVKTYRFRRLK